MDDLRIGVEVTECRWIPLRSGVSALGWYDNDGFLCVRGAFFDVVARQDPWCAELNSTPIWPTHRR